MCAQGGPPAVLYAAKSTEDRHGSIPDQLRRTRELAESSGWAVAAEFSDEGFSAYTRNRGPGLDAAKARAMELAADHGECFLLALHSDRVARGAGDAPGAADHLVELVAYLRRHGVKLRTVEDDFYADDRIGLLMAAVQGQRNTEDSRRKAESVSAGFRRRATERGRHNGPAPYGYRYGAGGAGLEIIETEAKVVRRVFEEFTGGRNMSAIAKELHEDSVPTKTGAYWRQAQISQMLRNPVYIGKVRSKGEEFPGVHEPILETGAWERAAQLLAANPARPGRPRKASGHLFTGGLLRCARCGDPMVPRTSRGGAYEYYLCTGDIHGCDTGTVRRRELDDAALACFERVAVDVGDTCERLQASAAREGAEAEALLGAAEVEEAGAKARLQRVKRDYVHGELTAADWRELRAELAVEAGAAEGQVGLLRRQLEAAQRRTELRDVDREAVEQLAELRAAIAAEVRRTADLEPVRALLWRLFERFLFHPRKPRGPCAGLRGAHYWVEPVIRAEVLTGDEERGPLASALRRHFAGEAEACPPLSGMFGPRVG